MTDFNTIDIPSEPGTPRIHYLGEILTGYGTAPYKGNTAFLRLSEPVLSRDDASKSGCEG